MHHEVKSRGADQVQPWQIVPGSQNTADRDVGPVEFTQSLQQDLWRAGPHGGIGKGLGKTDDFRLRDQPEPGIFGKLVRRLRQVPRHASRFPIFVRSVLKAPKIQIKDR
jgi:hypothetical protein